MKQTLLALIMCKVLLAGTDLQAEAKPFKEKTFTKQLSKDKSLTTFFAASDTQPLSIPPILTDSNFYFNTSNFVPVTFTQEIHAQGKGIKAGANGASFLLEKGTYYVLFTGTFSTTALFGFFDVGLQLGSELIFVNSHSLDTFVDSTGVVNLYKVIDVKEDSSLSVVVDNESFSEEEEALNEISALTRSITIIKLK